MNKKLTKIFFGLIILVLIILVIYLFTKQVLKKNIYPLKHMEIIQNESKSNKIDPYLILAIIKAESNFDANATSKKYAKGLMQIRDTTADEVNSNFDIPDEEINIYDVETNIKIGTSYFAKLIKRYDGNYYLAICAYNAGLGNVDKWIENGIIPEDLDQYEDTNIPFKETKNYLKKVINNYKIYKFLYDK